MYIGHLPHGFYEHELHSFFSQFGDLTRIHIARTKKGKSKGYAFITFKLKQVAEIVTSTMDGHILSGHTLVCRMRPKKKRMNASVNCKKMLPEFDPIFGKIKPIFDLTEQFKEEDGTCSVASTLEKVRNGEYTPKVFFIKSSSDNCYHKISLTRPGVLLDRQFFAGSIGISYEGNEITKVARNSQAAKAGVCVGWIIFQVNNNIQPDDSNVISESIALTADNGLLTNIQFDTLGIRPTWTEKQKTRKDICRAYLTKKGCHLENCNFVHLSKKERKNFHRQQYCWNFNSSSGCNDVKCKRKHLKWSAHMWKDEDEDEDSETGCEITSYTNANARNDKIIRRRKEESSIPKTDKRKELKKKRMLKKQKKKNEELKKLGINYEYQGYQFHSEEKPKRMKFD